MQKTDALANTLPDNIGKRIRELHRQFETQNPDLFIIDLPEIKDNRDYWDDIRAQRRARWHKFVESIYGPLPKRKYHEPDWKAERNALHREHSNQSEIQANQTFENFQFITRIEDKKRDIKINGQYYSVADIREKSLNTVKDLAEGSSTYKLILICGRYGGGKTHLSHAAVNRVLERGLSAMYYHSSYLFSEWHKAMKESPGAADAFLGMLEQCDFLVLDDMGIRDDPTAAQQEIFERLVDCRYREHKPLIVTTNRDRLELGAAIASRFDDALISRKVIMDLPDYRPQKGK